MVEIRLKQIEIPLVEVQTAPLVASTNTDGYPALAAQELEPALQESMVPWREGIVYAVAVLNREGFESVHLSTESIPVAFYAAHQNAAEFRILRRMIEAGAEFGKQGPRDGNADTDPLNLP